MRAQGADIHPSPGRKLEILADAAIKEQTAFGPLRIFELECVAEPIKTLFIEGRSRQLILAPIARRDIGPARPRLQPVLRAILRKSGKPDLRGDQLELHPRYRQANIERVLALPGSRERHGLSLGRAKAGQEHDALATGRKSSSCIASNTDCESAAPANHRTLSLLKTV